MYPVYLLSLAVVAPFIAADATPEKTPLVAAHGLLLQGWLGHIPVNWNTPAWSLSCEIFFYVSFPLAATVVLRAGWWRTLAVALGACTLTRVLWACGVPDEIKPVVHLSDFLMGVAAARIYGLLAERGWTRSGAWLYVPAVALGGAAIARSGVAAGRGGSEFGAAAVERGAADRAGDRGRGSGARARVAGGGVSREGELCDVHPARPAAVVVSAMVAGGVGVGISGGGDRGVGAGVPVCGRAGESVVTRSGAGCARGLAISLSRWSNGLPDCDGSAASANDHIERRAQKERDRGCTHRGAICGVRGAYDSQQHSHQEPEDSRSNRRFAFAGPP